MVEAAARQIFTVLTELKDVVIFFDEIDRLILDRNSDEYGQQGELFQFMTPSMLAKLNDLASAKKTIFIIATNYLERIDSAIKRPGRIDVVLLCLPYSLEARIDAIKQTAEKMLKSSTTKQVIFTKKHNEKIRQIALKTALTTSAELQRLIRNSAPDTDSDPQGFLTQLLSEAEDQANRIGRSISLASEKQSESPLEPLIAEIGLLLVKVEVDKSVKDELVRTWGKLRKAIIKQGNEANLKKLRDYFIEWVRKDSIELDPDETFPLG